MKPEEYAKLIGRSAHFVRLACQQGQIKSIVITHGKRHEYEILEGRHYETSNETSDQVVPVGGVDTMHINGSDGT